MLRVLGRISVAAIQQFNTVSIWRHMHAHRIAPVCSLPCRTPPSPPQPLSQQFSLQRLPDLYKHMLAVSYQMAVALEVAGAAAALNRTLVYPRFYCWCDFDWYAVVLDGCAMGGRPGAHGADLFEKPFECPIDVIFNPHPLYHRGAPYRQARWLDSPRLPAAVARSREPVLLIDQRDTAALLARERMVRRLQPSACLLAACCLLIMQYCA